MSTTYSWHHTPAFLKNNMDPPPPWSTLRLLIPPLRLMSAFLWQVVKEQKLEHYDKVENIVSLVTEIVPDLLSSRQKASLIMGLRVKVLLEMCRGDLGADTQTVRAQLLKSQASHLAKDKHSEMESLKCTISGLILELLDNPLKKEEFFQKVYPVEYGHDFDKALQVLICHFIARLENLLPIPNFKQVSSWMTCDFLWEQSVCSYQMQDLQYLLLDNCHQALEPNALPSVVEDRIISSLSFPFATDAQDGESESSQDEQSFEDDAMRHFDKSCDEADPSSSIGLDGRSKSADWPDGDVELGIGGTRDNGDATDTNVLDLTYKGTAAALGKPPSSLAGNLDQHVLPECSGKVPAQFMSEKRLEKKRPLLQRFLTSTANRKHAKGQETQSKGQSGQRSSLTGSWVSPSQKSLAEAIHQMLSDISSNKQDSGGGTGTLSEAMTQSPDMSDPSRKSPPTSENSSEFKSLFHGISSDEPKRSIRRNRALRPCCECGQSFLSYADLLLHKKCHPGKQVHQCAQCGLKLADNVALATHRCKQSSMTTYICGICGMAISSFAALQEHEKMHSGPFQCSLCCQIFESLVDMLDHEKIHAALDFEPEPEPKEPVAPKLVPKDCQFCGLTLPSAEECDKHEKTHVERKPGQYRLRGKRGRKPRRDDGFNTGDNVFFCEFCGESFIRESQFKEHKQMHAREHDYRCPLCGEVFCFLRKLKVHIRGHSGEIPHICSTCGKSFASAGELKTHARSHPTSRPFKCDVCDRTFLTSGQRKIHYRTHTGERPYACNVCGKRFMVSNSFREHILIHTNERPFKCALCPKAFRRRHHLKAHGRMHEK